jgi:membrane-associated phospholipid phosphatase
VEEARATRWSSPSTRRTRVIFAAFACGFMAAYVLLGCAVSARQNPPAFDLLFAAWSGKSLELAWILTSSGLFFALALVDAIALGGGLVQRRWLPRSIFAIVTDTSAWFVSDFFKAVFHRRRPAHWLIHQETSSSYASGHAMHSMLVYGLWALFFWRSSLPAPFRLIASSALVIWMLGICWSRLALNAHFATDLVGGWLLALSMLSLGFAIYPAVLRRP